MLLKITSLNIGQILMIRVFILIILVLQGCAYASKDIFTIAKNQITGFTQLDVGIEDINKSKYSFMMVKLGRGPEIKLILNSHKDGLYEWISADMERIYTYKGLIVRTQSLEHNLLIKDFKNFSLADKSQTLIVSFDNPELINASINFRIKKLGKSKVSNVYGNLEEYELFKEMSDIGWKSKGRFWLSEDGQVIESIQKFHPFYQKIHFRIFLKY